MLADLEIWQAWTLVRCCTYILDSKSSITLAFLYWPFQKGLDFFMDKNLTLTPGTPAKELDIVSLKDFLQTTPCTSGARCKIHLNILYSQLFPPKPRKAPKTPDPPPGVSDPIPPLIGFGWVGGLAIVLARPVCELAGVLG